MRVNSIRFKRINSVYRESGKGENKVGELRSRVYHRIFYYLPFPREQNKMVAVSLHGSEINLARRERDIFEQTFRVRRIVHKTRRSDLPYTGKSLSFNQKIKRYFGLKRLFNYSH